jgi:hypothetical protein
MPSAGRSARRHLRRRQFDHGEGHRRHGHHRHRRHQHAGDVPHLRHDLDRRTLSGGKLSAGVFQPVAFSRFTWNGGTLELTASNAVIASLADGGNISDVVDLTAGKTLRVTGTAKAIRVLPSGTLSFNGGKVDLTNKKMIVANGSVGTASGGVYAGLSRRIQTAADGGAWDGPGITTSLPDAPAGLTGIGIGRADELGYAGNNFAGVSVAATDVLVMYTYAGDANLDGFISGDDYSAIDFNILVPNASGWTNGDFNWDGVISGDDYSAIDFNILAQGAPFPINAARPTRRRDRSSRCPNLRWDSAARPALIAAAAARRRRA